jgi:NADH-quinone oxidoreductase subunit N
MSHRIGLILGDAGMEGMPMRYGVYLGLDQFMRNLIATAVPLVLSDNYEHFMAKLPGKPYGPQQAIISWQIGGFNVAILVRVIATFQVVYLLVQAMIMLAIVSMTVGNLSAIYQKDFKRLMAFSSIAHGGYILVGILCLTAWGISAVIFYAAAVLVLKFTCFMVMVALARDGRNLQISELAGRHQRSPILALALMMALFGLAGIPPTIGFSGKFLIFTAAIEQGYLALVLIAMVNVVISLYYYLLALKAAYLDKPATEQAPCAVSASSRLLAMAMIAVIVAVEIYPSALLNLVMSAAQSLH